MTNKNKLLEGLEKVKGDYENYLELAVQYESKNNKYAFSILDTERSKLRKEFSKNKKIIQAVGDENDLLERMKFVLSNSADWLTDNLYSIIEDLEFLIGEVEDSNQEELSQNLKKKNEEEFYVDTTVISQLGSIQCSQFSLVKLIKICKEINICYKNECYFGVAILLRSILDHVPPIFEQKNFISVVNQYSDGGKSFKDAAKILNNSRVIADTHLHRQIRKRESLPTKNQISHQPQLELLLNEIIVILSNND